MSSIAARVPWLPLGALVLSVGCGAPASQSAPRGPAASVAGAEGLNFAIGAPQGKRLLSEELRGRRTLILFITTYDTASQLMALRLNELLHTARPRINVAAVVMEAAKYEMLTDTYKQTLGLHYPVVLADSRTLAGGGALGRVQHIPTVVVLDREGRKRALFAGPATAAELEAALRRAER